MPYTPSPSSNERFQRLVGEVSVMTMADEIASYRQALIDGGVPEELANTLTHEMHGYMCTTAFPAPPKTEAWDVA